MHLAVEACLIEIDLDVASGADFFGLQLIVERNSDQLVTRKHPGARGSGIMFDALGDNVTFDINPLDTIPRRRFVFDPLTEVEEAGADQ
jgi:hypothetical protein